jgi:hypothetical protein
VGFAGFYGEHFDRVCLELIPDDLAIQRRNVRVRDDGVLMGRSQLTGQCSDLGKETGGDADGRPRQVDLARFTTRGLAYQVTSPAPVWTLATRASMKSRSDRRLR